MGNKLFVFGGHNNYDCEVFDSRTNKFVFVENLPVIRVINAVSFGYKIYVFQKFQGNDKKEKKSEMLIFCYNKKQNAWIQENILQLESFVESCAKMSKK